MPAASDSSLFGRVAMLCIGDELYGVGSVQKIYALGAPGIAFICFREGHLWEWLGEHKARRFLVPGLAKLTAGFNSAAFLTRVPGAMRAAAATADGLMPLLEREGLKIVHSHWLPQNLVSGHLRRRGLRVVWQIHNNSRRERMLGLGRRLNRVLARWGADMLLPVSDFIAGNWRGSVERIRTIRNAAPSLFHAPNSLPPSPVRCVIAGRVHECKGQHLALGAVLAARRAGIDVRLDIFGGPVEANPYADALRGEVEQAGAGEAVRFMGFRADVRRHHQDYHLGLHCRIDPEPCSVWVCETLVDGLALLAAANGGTPELVQDGRTGLLFRSGDGDDLTAKLIEVARDPARMEAFRVAAFERGREHFTVERVIRETGEAYRELLEMGALDAA